MNQHDQDEVILRENPKRFVVFLVEYQDLWHMYKKAQALLWTAEEIDLSRDVLDWMCHMSEPERRFILLVLAFFAASDGIVNENLAQRFFSEVTIAEARSFYGFQIMMENVHSETYANLITTLVTDANGREALFRAMLDIPCVAKKAEWAMRWIESKTEPFNTRLVAFAVVEGIFFSASFAAIFWLKQRGVMPGLCFSNELISRDEGIHTEFVCLLFQYLSYRPSKEKVTLMITEAVEIEKAFAREALPEKLSGMNYDLLGEYVEFVADQLLTMLGYPKYYMTTNPFPFMQLIATEGKTNFFERQNSEYRLGRDSSPSRLPSDDDLF